jgi:5'-nucleotidase / UDP-sugar diphosphatase
MRALSRLACVVALVAGPAGAETIKLTLLGVGDVYNFEEEDGRGGFARLNAVAKAERAANPNTLYLFNGDMLSPSLASGFDKGQNTIDFTNMVPFDLAVPGNHEFDFGPENFMEKMKASKYPWAAINITNGDGSAIEGLGGVMVKEVGGLKIALIPVAQDTSPEVSSTGRRSREGAGRGRGPRRRRGTDQHGERPRSDGKRSLRRDPVGRRPFLCHGL